HRAAAARGFVAAPLGRAPDRLPHRTGPGRAPHRPGRVAARARRAADAADHPAPGGVAARRRDPRGPGARRGTAAPLRRSGRRGSALGTGARTGSLPRLRAIPRGSAPAILRDAAAGIAGSDGIAREQLHQLARALGMSPIPVSAEARALYHAAAVLAAAGQVALFSRAVKAFQMATGAPEPIARAAL